MDVETGPGANRSAWARYARLMRWMALVALACAGAALGFLRAGGPIPLHEAIATVLGVTLTVLLGTGLMGLGFASRDSGHDAAAGQRFEEEP